ncbi:hypothetical protein V8G54_029721, partial [Vigna mungo]
MDLKDFLPPGRFLIWIIRLSSALSLLLPLSNTSRFKYSLLEAITSLCKWKLESPICIIKSVGEFDLAIQFGCVCSKERARTGRLGGKRLHGSTLLPPTVPFSSTATSNLFFIIPSFKNF